MDSWDGPREPRVLQLPSNTNSSGNNDADWHAYNNFPGHGNNGHDLSGATARAKFREFFRNFKVENIFFYRDSLISHYNRHEYFIEVDLAHVQEFDPELFDNLQTRPIEMIGFFELAAKDALQVFLLKSTTHPAGQEAIPDFQVILKSAQLPQSIRHLTADHVNKLLKVPGIIISCSRVRAKAVSIAVKCTKCGCVKRLPSRNPMGGVTIPSRCDRDGRQGEDCGPAPFIIMADRCEYIDQQTLKLQESPEVVPTGEMPRNIMLTVDRYLVDKVVPGTRISVMGVFSLFNSSAKEKLNTSAIRTSYLRIVGIMVENEGSGRTTLSFTPQQEEEMRKLARDPDIYNKIARSIAPRISGAYTDNIKKAIACLLMGGSRKVLPDGTKLRGDINVLLMGDPSTAKSQFLKFVERVAPVAVYTSGKGSSAAGLTASVIKDSRGEFFLEGGAMVLADSGVICIDEFDKMRDTDRVAIHEAMEQQTISIAKAGITTMLNSRVSVLAAANPIFGRYDDLKSVGENIDLMTTILSRFDCIFIVRDERNTERDKNIARHVLNVHINSVQDAAPEGEIDGLTLKRYISYCRAKCAPRLNNEAAAMLSSQYVHIRNNLKKDLQDTGEAVTVPITVRQLEALIRISEALAKMRLSAEATVNDVNEAIRLFSVSTVEASRGNKARISASIANPDIQRVEDFLRKRLAIKMTVNARKIVEEAHVHGFSHENISRAICAMIMKGDLQELNQRKLLRRLR